jgi:hypothetical protein
MSIVEATLEHLQRRAVLGAEWEPALGLKLHFGNASARLDVAVDAEIDAAPATPALGRAPSERSGWWLWVWLGRWQLEHRDAAPVTASSNRRKIDQALALLDGQHLVEASIQGRDGSTRMEFDQGGVVSIRGSLGEDGEMWSLYDPGGYVLTVRTDGQYSHSLGTASERWRAIGD